MAVSSTETPEQTAPAEAPQEPRPVALSPSRAKDFMQCPLLFRFRAVDRLPEPPSPAAVKGTLVHSVLERLYDLPAAQRDPAAGVELLAPAWEQLRAERPDVEQMFGSPEELHAWLVSARELVERYFQVENPQRLEPAEREKLLEVELASGMLLRGFVDRLDVAPTGAVRVVDYKTGRSPMPQYASEALFQMRFYGLMLWRLTGTAPRRLQLVYLGDGQVLTLDPTLDELLATEEQVESIWAAITRAAQTGRFQPRVSRLCDWCSFRDLCPSFGGTPPEPPQEGLDRLLAATQRTAADAVT
ncbi:RecB family exonuclease [Georgenia sp. H159]|uniref:RecB family exonuclease n=1 Tax=Georgenia sp. H159 TaxID=3076115 RepID=UPI002D788C65|nr:RecB family exonuclease [Georgenia sp. H159]